MGTLAIPDLGEHCSHPDCHQLDFLPFTCNACNKVFCLEHRQHGSHNCPNANDRDVRVIVCPMCQKSIRTVPNEDENVTWERHVGTDCDPSNHDKVTKKPRCPVRGCKELLVFSNKVLCNDCKAYVCVKHRFGPDHGCDKLRKENNINRSIFSNYSNMWNKKSSSGDGKVISPAHSKTKRPAAANGAGVGASGGSIAGAFSGLYSSLEAGINKLGLMAGTSSSTSSGTSSSSGLRETEECPQCRARFTNVAQLIKHVETMHEARGSQEMLDVCPKCGMKFQDPIQLVNHVERDHSGSSSSKLRR